VQSDAINFAVVTTRSPIWH